MTNVRVIAAGCAAAILLAGTVAGLARTGAASANDVEDGLVVHPITPCRLFDTRPDTQVGPHGGPLGAGEIIEVDGVSPSGNCADQIPADADGLVVNLTGVGATAATYVQLFPTGADQELTSTINLGPGDTPSPNEVTVRLGDAQRFSAFNAFGSVHLVGDVTAYLARQPAHAHDSLYYSKEAVDDLVATAIEDALDQLPVSDGPESVWLTHPSTDWTKIGTISFTQTSLLTTISNPVAGSAMMGLGGPDVVDGNDYRIQAIEFCVHALNNGGGIDTVHVDQLIGQQQIYGTHESNGWEFPGCNTIGGLDLEDQDAITFRISPTQTGQVVLGPVRTKWVRVEP